MLNRPEYPKGKKGSPVALWSSRRAHSSPTALSPFAAVWSGKLHAPRNVCRRSAPWLNHSSGSNEVLSTHSQIDGEVLADGTQGDKTQQDWSSTEVALVPVTAPDELFDLPHTTSLDQYGHFSFHDVQPGKYRIYAEGQIGIYRWSNPNFVREMESMGTDVEVREKDELRLQLKQIPKEETARILDKLSLQ
jgi:hypothetical protein